MSIHEPTKISSLSDALNLDNSPFLDDVARYFHYTLGRNKVNKSHVYLYHAIAHALRDRLVARYYESHPEGKTVRQAAYLSLEFLIGRSLGNSVLNLNLQQDVKEIIDTYARDLETLFSAEHDAGLGNGGLGRLAACFLDSCASLALPVRGYGLRYEYGMFNQSIENNEQIEQPDKWLREGNPWEICDIENTKVVKFFGQSTHYTDRQGKTHYQWVNTQDILAVPYDMFIPGYQNDHVNLLRLWKSEATDEFNLSEFNSGDYAQAVAHKNLAEQITMVLYPNDASENGKELRLRQQYFLASASLQDMLDQWVKAKGENFDEFAKYHVFQLNDTHPTIAVAELMRLLLDDHDLSWEKAWEITTSTMAYTNHTLLPEALEKWSVGLFQSLLPRLLEIIYEINSRFLQQVSNFWPCDLDKLAQLSLIEEGDDPQVRMAHLAIVGSFSVNGVAGLHTQLLKEGLFKDFYQLWPEKFNNKTNGVTPRRWLAHCNPQLASLISDKIGSDWVSKFETIQDLKQYATDKTFIRDWQAIKFDNKQQLASIVKAKTGVDFDPNMLFDVQVKRIHEYKRQLLNILHVIHLYNRIIKGDTQNITPRCVLIGGKAAPGYYMAKLIIRFINHVANTINDDPRARQYLRVAFLPNYNVSLMEKIAPATDLSEQISTAGKEASGTGNMKFMMNGALTIGTLDGANVEINQALDGEHFFLFGAKTEDIPAIRQTYNPAQILEQNQDLADVV
ncbi:MAG: glycogen/starch/alpha-glucan phosphorylase, partial [Vibrio sp.]